MGARKISAIAVGVLCGYLVGYSISHTKFNFAVVVRDGSIGWFGPGATTSAIGAAVVALLTVGLISWFRLSYWAAVAAGLLGVVLIVAVAGLSAEQTQYEQQLVVSVAAGLLTAAAVVRPQGQVWFVGGSMTAMLYGTQIQERLKVPADYFSTRSVADPSVGWPLFAAVAVALLAAGFFAGKKRDEVLATGKQVVVGLGACLGIGILIVAAAQSLGDPPVVIATGMAVGALVLGMWLPRADGVAVLTVLAIAAMIAIDPSEAYLVDGVSLVAQLALMVVAVVAGMTWRSPIVGIGLCGVVALSALVPALLESTSLTTFVFRYVLPVAVGFAIGACLPVSSPTVIVLMIVPVVAACFEFSAGAEAVRRKIQSSGSAASGEYEGVWMSGLPDTYALTTNRTGAVVVAVTIIIGCAAAVFRRRQSAAD